MKEHKRRPRLVGFIISVSIIGLVAFGVYQCSTYDWPSSSSSSEEDSSSSEVSNLRTVWFDLNGYNSIDPPSPQSADIGSLLTQPSLTRIGYFLQGWTDSPSGGTYWDFATDTIADNMTLYAQWFKNTYTAFFDLNGGAGTLPISQQTTYLSFDDTERTNMYAMPTTTDFTNGALTFNGWWLKDNLGNFTQEWNFASDLPLEDMTLYAGWGSVGEFNHYEYIEYDTAVKITGYNDTTYVGGTLLIPDYIHSKPVLSIGVDAFNNFFCTDEIALPDTLTTIQTGAFRNSQSPFQLVIPDKVTSIGTRAFANCPNLYSVEFGTGLRNIGVQAFYECDNLGSQSEIVIPSNVLSIDDRAFDITEVLQVALEEGISFSEGLIYIGPSAFAHGNFSSLELPDSVEYIGREAFSYCRDLAEIHIGKGILSIGYDAFRYANSNTPTYLHVYIDAVTPPILASAVCFGEMTWSGGNPSRPGLWFIVPDGSVDAYEADPQWSMYYHDRFVTFMIS